MTRDDLLTLLAIASGNVAAPPWHDDQFKPGMMRPPTPDEWAAHLMAHAKALGRAVDAELEESAREVAAVVEAAEHLHECQPDQCAAGCPVIQRYRDGAARRTEEAARECDRRAVSR